MHQSEPNAPIAAHVRDFMEARWRVKKSTFAGYYFFLGTSLALLASLIALLLLPPLEPSTFSMVRFLSAFPLFYTAFWVLFFLWCAGFVTQACDEFGINFRYILRIDPDCPMNPRWLLMLAAILTTVWLLTFGTYVIDYKWLNTDSIAIDEVEVRYHDRLDRYPIALLVITAAVLFWPYSKSAYGYRGAIVLSVVRTMLAPCFAVSFADNIAGDVLTSLVKPVQDASGAFCYMAASHPHTATEVARFEASSSVCPDWSRDVLEPLISALPLFFRAMQCLRRYYDTDAGMFQWKRFRHIANFGKYCTSLAVVAVGAAHGGRSTSRIAVAALATVYSATWDIKMDFAIDSMALTGGEQKRIFSPRVYLSACVADIALRLVWVLSLFPVGVLTQGLVNRLLFRAVISALELLRRSMWFILRVEHEQDALQLLKEKRDSESSLFGRMQPRAEPIELSQYYAKSLRSLRSF